MWPPEKGGSSLPPTRARGSRWRGAQGPKNFRRDGHLKSIGRMQAVLVPATAGVQEGPARSHPINPFPALTPCRGVRNSTPYCTPPETPLNGPADPAGCSPATRVPLGTFPLPWGISSDQKRARAGAAPGPLQPSPVRVWRYRATDPHRLVTERSHDPGPLWHDACEGTRTLPR